MPAARPTDDDHDLVVLRVPADTGYARVIRVAVSAYAVRLGLAPAAVEDLRLAVDETLILLMGSSGPGAPADAGDGAGPIIVLTLDCARDRPPVVLELHLEPAADGAEPDASALARFEEIMPSSVAIDVLDRRHGRVALRHPA